LTASVFFTRKTQDKFSLCLKAVESLVCGVSPVIESGNTSYGRGTQCNGIAYISFSFFICYFNSKYAVGLARTKVRKIFPKMLLILRLRQPMLPLELS